MAYIRDKHEELTGFQESGYYQSKFDMQPDFAMVYGLETREGFTMEERIAQYREQGYVIHLMTGISWGAYTDYLYGRWDGINHWDEAQVDRYGNQILHGPDCPYMVPTIAFADFLTEGLKKAVDAGVEAIHVEEPEFWDRGGYSEGFKKEYLLYYKTPWVAPHESVDAHYKCAKLKAYLYKRTIDRVSAGIKSYALSKYGRLIRFYVPTHSLLNYTQWKIVSPEALLTDVPTVDGYIAQIWTGTSRTQNTYEGVPAERTFETSYLEYGIMQELVKGTGRRMWFLHDPIEDNLIFDWNDYRYNYLKTVSASLLHPKINTYEICPWPRRVFGGKYPQNSPDAETIPDEYASILNNTFNTLGDMEIGESTAEVRTGVLMSDTSLYQRNYPDSELQNSHRNEVTTVMRETEDDMARFRNELFAGKGDKQLKLKFEKSDMLPSFYGLTLPLLKYGVPIRPVLLDNARRYVGYLDDYDVIVMSYEFCKPDYPDENAALANWVNEGGTLIYVGDGTDPFHGISSFWTGKYPSAAEHLFDLLGVSLGDGCNKGIFKVGKGCIAIWKKAPCALCYSKENADEWREFYGKVIGEMGYTWNKSNFITEKRGPYTVAAVFDETDDNSPFTMNGLFADMYTPAFDIVENVSLAPGKNGLWFDFSRIEGENLRVIGTGARIFSLEDEGDAVKINFRGASDAKLNIRIRTPYPVSCSDDPFTCERFTCQNDAKTKTALLSYDSRGEEFTLSLKKCGEWN